MSIAATIEAVTVIYAKDCMVCKGTGKDPETQWDDCPQCHGGTEENPKVRIKLGPLRGEGPGQNVLTIINPPDLAQHYLSSLIGIEIWGGSDSIYIGEKKWAKRVGYTKIQLIPKEKV